MTAFFHHVVNQHFRRVYEELERSGRVKSKTDIGKALGTYNHVINSILKGDRNLTVDQLHKLFQTYSVDANYLFGIGKEMFTEDADNAHHLPTRSLDEREFGRRNNITLVPDLAMAGYALEHQEQSFLAELPRFSIPHLEGNLVAFEIHGDSMYPTITNGDIIVCEHLEHNDPLRDNNVYVVVTDVVVAKRIQQIRHDDKVKELRLISDNSNVYKPYEVDIGDIRQLLRVKCRLTSYAIS